MSHRKISPINELRMDLPIAEVSYETQKIEQSARHSYRSSHNNTASVPCKCSKPQVTTLPGYTIQKVVLRPKNRSESLTVKGYHAESSTKLSILKDLY